MVRVAAKWGFGNAPLKNSHKAKTEASIRIVLSILERLPDDPTIHHLDAISHVKGQFTRLIKQDQWDWSTVWHLLGRPSRHFAHGISNNLGIMRTALKDRDFEAASRTKDTLISLNILKYLNLFLAQGSEYTKNSKQSGPSGYIYILSTRALPTYLKIGMTHRPVAIRAKEINSATGLIIPFGIRASWRVDNAKDVEQELHHLFVEYRIRVDREFFEIDFHQASKLINDYLRRRRVSRKTLLQDVRGNDGDGSSVQKTCRLCEKSY